jgi:hypothetical protein
MRPPNEAVAFELYLSLGPSRSHPAVAAHLGIPLGTVRSWARRYHWSARLPGPPARVHHNYPAWSSLREPKCEPTPTPRVTATEWLEKFLSRGAKTTSEIREAALAAHFNWAQIRHVAEMLLVDEQPEVWAIPIPEVSSLTRSA